MKKIFDLILIVLIATMMNACVHINSAIDKDQPTQVRNAGELKVLDQFSRINFAGSMQVIFSQGDQYTVRVDAPQQVVDKLVIYVRSKELNICSKDNLIDFDPAFSFSQVKIFVTSPNIKQIDLTGSGSMTVKDAVTASRLDIDITGTGNMSFTGTLSCNFLDVDITGSGNLDFANVKADKIETDVTGVGNVNYSRVNAGNIGSNITGAGNITIAGDAEKHIKNVTGVGNIDDTNLKVGKSVA